MPEPAWKPIYHARARRCVGLAAALCLAAGSHAGLAAAEPAAGSAAYTNRLIRSNDPYLLLHAHNPVDWYPWGPEAFARAREEDKPIFLSIGYSTCYWCHVAERTIYSNPEIAKLMNQWFVNVKVDSEQRPDVDRIYMLARQIMTGAGGWPNNLFLTPDLKPFYAGSYFPPKDEPRAGPGFPTILAELNRAWTSERAEVLSVAENVMAAMRRVQAATTDGGSAPIEPGAWLAKARDRLLSQLDPEHGGFADERSRTKFPGAPRLAVLLADYEFNRTPAALSGVLNALDAIAFGGIHDQLAGGFHRYSTEPTWSVPHFEKMLYDNAQLLRLYSSAFRITGKSFYREIATSTARYLAKDMMSPEGGFYTARDAQLDGVEGEGYLWTRGEIASLLGPDESARFFGAYSLTPIPRPDVPDIVHPQDVNGEPPAVLRLRVPMDRTLEGDEFKDATDLLAAFAPDRARLMAVRETRRQPARDEKMVMALNGLAIAALAESGQILDRPEFMTLAKTTAERMWSLAYDQEKGVLRHEIFHGQAQTEGFLQDYASLGSSFMTLFDITRDETWLGRAERLATDMLDRFGRPDGRFSTSPHENDLLIPIADEGDLEMPSGTSMAIDLLLRLHGTSAAARYLDAVMRAVRASSGQFQERPEAWASAVAALARNSFRPASEKMTTAKAADAPNGPGGLRAPVSADHIRVKASATRESNGEVIVATITVDDNFHINANPASFDFLVPTTLDLVSSEAARIEYPKPTRFTAEFAPEGLDVYEGSVAIVARFPKGSLKSLEAIRGTVTAQACTNRICLPPSTVPVSIADIGR